MQTPITERFVLPAEIVDRIKAEPYEFGFNGFGSIVYQRTYSREMIEDDQVRKEIWPDTVLRVVQGAFSLLKHHYLKHGINFNDHDYHAQAQEMALAMMQFKWLPPGRGLFACGTDQVYKHGAAALNNCAAVQIKNLALDCEWIMLMLMNGVGVGCRLDWDGQISLKQSTETVAVNITDDREGWARSTKQLIESYVLGLPRPIFGYAQIRKKGTPLKTFGGVASGPGVLKTLHKRINIYMETYRRYKAGDPNYWQYHADQIWARDYSYQDPVQFRNAVTSPNKVYDAVRCQADIINAIGACVVSGGIRRSSLILLGYPNDETFLNLKNYDLINPERRNLGWSSNNSIIAEKELEPEMLNKMTELISINGEPGIFNATNAPYGRLLDSNFSYIGREAELDKAILTNPCGETELESYELCNLAEVFISRCADLPEFLKCVKLATFYTHVVSLIPTFSVQTNEVVTRNRRTGVSLSGITNFYDRVDRNEFVHWLDEGYKTTRAENARLAQLAGIPESIRTTVIKPSGTISQLVGVNSGMHWPTYQYAIRRIRISDISPLVKELTDKGYHCEKDVCSANTVVIEFPIKMEGRPSHTVSLEEQLELLSLLQQHWSDNMVSVSLFYKPGRDDLPGLLTKYLPKVKSLSVFPVREKEVYKQAPYEEITLERYNELNKLINNTALTASAEGDGEEPLFCTNDGCK